MPRGAPDYSNVNVAAPLHRLDDLGEAVVRLGSIVTHDRAGRVVFLDKFEYGLSDWQIALSGTDAEICLVSTPFRSGPFSVRFTAGSDASRQAKLFRKFPYPQLGKYGLEFSWKPESHTSIVAGKLIKHDDTYDREFAFRYILDDQTLSIRDSDGVWQTIDDGLYLDYQYAPFHTFKIVGDLETLEFVRLIVNENVYTDLPYYAYPYAADDGPNVRVDIIVNGDEGFNGFSYIDDVILTQSEP